MKKRFTIIDGYNVLHVNGFVDGTAANPGSLEKARHLLLAMLARQMDQPSRSRTTIVFDSQRPQLPQRWTMHDMLVEFAADYHNADELIAILIRQHSAPKQLLVVSSDHQVQKVAKARAATAMDSDVWWDCLATQPTPTKTGESAEKPAATSGPIDLGYWMSTLGLETLAEEELLQDSQALPRRDQATPDSSRSPKIKDAIFPPGYADDLFDDDT